MLDAHSCSFALGRKGIWFIIQVDDKIDKQEAGVEMGTRIATMSWQTVVFSSAVKEHEFDSLQMLFGKMHVLRIQPSEDGSKQLQVLLEDSSQIDQLSSLFERGLVDIRLRASIEAQSGHQINALVESVLLRAADQK